MDIQPVSGFRAAGVACGIKESGALDLALIAADGPCTAAGVFTTNRVKAAPVLYDAQVVVSGQPVRAVIANSGNANACTGELGMLNTIALAEKTARHLGCTPGEVLVLSTGVIGVQLPMGPLQSGVEAAVSALSPDGWDAAAQAILTTDTRPKFASVTSKAGYTVTGIAKGSGMIAPHMATMLAVIATDAAVEHPALQQALSAAAEVSFNRIVVDGDMSTNDTLLTLASGASGTTVDAGDPAFQQALEQVCIELARAIVRDGEGATKFVTLEIVNGPDDASTKDVARAIATSPLCKTAFYGADPNWGRIIAAAGRSGVSVDPDALDLWLIGADGPSMQLLDAGQPTDYDEPAAVSIMQADAFTFRLDLHMGASAVTVWTCDLSHEYVSINAEYRT